MFIIKVLATFAIVFFLTYAVWYAVDAEQARIREKMACREYIIKYMKLERAKEWLCSIAAAEILICLLVVLVAIWV